MTELPNRLLRDALDEAASAPSAACLDAPTLAAWMDGTLTRAERATVETHAAGCARCLALVAAMARTEPAAPERPRWRVPLVWVPLATLAAALIVVRLALVERQPPATVESTSTANRPSPPAGAPIVAPPVARTETSVPEQPKRKRAAAPVSPAPPAIAPPPTTAPSATAPLTATASSAATQSVPAAAPVPTAVAAATPAPVAPLQLMRDEVTVAQTDATAVAARSMQKTAAPAPVVIRSPDPDSQWRIVGGTVEHTADGGATWQAQPIGVPAQMRAGAAPDARVCWMVGAGGVVLRTTDGATWTRVAFPAADDLVAVQASDASRATVTTAAGLRFATGDGGATWARQ